MNPDFEWKGEELYLDNAATTMIDPEVVRAMRPYLEERYGNPQTVYRLGREAWDAVTAARAFLADFVKAEPRQVFFTSGGTESNNWAVKCFHNGSGGRNILYGAVEHASVVEPATWMAQIHPGVVSAKAVPVDETGMIRLESLEQYLKDGGVGLVSVQIANNEVGTLQPVAEIGALCRKYKVLFHCDAVQGLGKVDIDVDDLGADFVSFSAHKIHGPKGIGALYVRSEASIAPMMHGGGHEMGMRSGTLPTYQIVGFGKVVELAKEALRSDMPRLDRIVRNAELDMEQKLKGRINGNRKSRLPNILSVSVPGLEGGVVCGILCSKYGVCVSAGSACNTKTSRTSHVLEAMGRKEDSSRTLRFSLSRYTTERDVRLATARLEAAIRESKERSLI